MAPEPPRGPDDEPAGGRRGARLVILGGLGLLVLGLIGVAAITSIRSAADGSEPELTASPLAQPTVEGSPSSSPAARAASSPVASSPAASPPAASPPAASPSWPGAVETPGPVGDPTAAADAARSFMRAFERPEGTKLATVTADISADSTPEVVIVSLVSGAIRIDVARWDGRQYEVVFTGQGGSADQLVAVDVADVTGDGLKEVVTIQSAGSLGRSLSVWGPGDGGFQPQRARGGCADGTHTFGVAGVRISPRRILASCDGTPLPPDLWPVDDYRWNDQAWTYRGTADMTAGQLSPPSPLSVPRPSSGQ